MAIVGPLIIEPDASSYCWITLDSGEQILISHDTEDAKKGCITVEAPNGFAATLEPLFACDLDGRDGRTVLAELTYGVRARKVVGTPLAVFVEYFKDCGSVAVVKSKCDALLFLRKCDTMATRSLSEAARTLLLEASRSPDGLIVRLISSQGANLLLKSNGRIFGDGRPHEQARWGEGVRELFRLGLVEVSSNGQVYWITPAGLRAADAVIDNDSKIAEAPES